MVADAKGMFAEICVIACTFEIEREAPAGAISCVPTDGAASNVAGGKAEDWTAMSGLPTACSREELGMGTACMAAAEEDLEEVMDDPRTNVLGEATRGTIAVEKACVG